MAAGSSPGSRTRTRRPSKRERGSSTAWPRRGLGRSMTTASTVSAASADQAWMVRSSVTRPLPWSSALRARPSEGSRRRSTTWRDISGYLPGGEDFGDAHDGWPQDDDEQRWEDTEEYGEQDL